MAKHLYYSKIHLKNIEYILSISLSCIYIGTYYADRQAGWVGRRAARQVGMWMGRQGGRQANEIQVNFKTFKFSVDQNV